MNETFTLKIITYHGARASSGLFRDRRAARLNKVPPVPARLRLAGSRAAERLVFFCFLVVVFSSSSSSSSSAAVDSAPGVLLELAIDFFFFFPILSRLSWITVSPGVSGHFLLF